MPIVHDAEPQAVPNKPMVPTAPTWPEDRSPRSGRQHIGEPFGRERRAAGLMVVENLMGGLRQRATSDERRLQATGNERRPEEHESSQRATFHEQRGDVASGEWRVAATATATRWRATKRRAVSDGNEQRGWPSSEVRRRAKPRATWSGRTSRWCRPQSGCCGSHDPLGAAAHRRAVRPQSDEATSGD